MRKLLALALVALLLTGCPKPPPPPSKGGPAGGGAGGAAGQDGGAGGGQDTTGGGADAGGEGAPAWRVIPDEVAQVVYPTLQPMSSWPDPISLKALSDLPQGDRPKDHRVLQLKQLVESLVAKELQPSDPDAALGVSAAGHLYMKLGKGKTEGSASMDVAPEDSRFPVFALTLLNGEDVGTLEKLRARTKRAVAEGLALELDEDDHQLEAHPKLKEGAQVAALALLDRNGFGMQFPYLYAYATKDHLMIVLQEVPHMTAPPEGDGK